MDPEIKKLMQEARYNEALKLLQDDSSQEALITTSVIFERKGKFRESLDLANKVFESVPIGSLLYLRALVNQAYAYWRLEDFESAFNSIDKGLSLNIDNKDEFIRYISELYYVKGILHHLRNEFEPSEFNFKRAYELRLVYGDDTLISHVLNALGIIYDSQGETAKSLQTYEEALKLKEAQGNKQDISRTVHNIAKIYEIQGEYEKARSFNNRGMELAQEYGSNRDYASFLINKASLLSKQAEYQLANEQLHEVCDIYEKDEYQYGKATVLSMLISNALEQSIPDKAHTYYNDLTQIQKRNPGPEFHLLLQINTARIKKNSRRMKDKVAAVELYQTLLDSSSVSALEKVSLMVEICELKIEEFNKFRDPSIIEDINQILDNLEKFSKKEHLQYHEVQNKILLAEFEYYKGDFEEAKRLLTQAQYLGIDKKYIKLAQYASKRFDELFVNVYKEELNFNNLTDAIDSMKQNFSKIEPSRLNESPLILFIMEMSGIVKFSRSFDDKFEIEVLLTASYISAISTFARDLFRTDDSLVQRIEHNEYSIYVLTFKDLQLCYLFKGNSLKALDHQIQVMNFIQKSSDILEDLISSNYGLEDGLKMRLNQFLDTVFLG
ncbi:MAG: tetratricopeptide repeat protein [Candidatus Heimdallarchaeota archaeon]|nr:tetratricopeptide repeat protein [Candidatus Heimdallarchaeota archaeon]